MLLAAVCFATASGPHPASAATLSIAVQGNHFVNGSGQTIRLLGVDRSGSEYMCTGGGGQTFDGPVDDPSIAAIVAWHTNAIRVPLNEDCWLGINGLPNGQTAASYQAAITDFVNRLHAQGQYVILDLHWNNGGTAQATGQQGMADADHAPAFWTSVATAFKNDPAVVFDLYNEPHDVTWDCWKSGGCTDPVGGFTVAGMQSLLNAVRATGATQPVMVGGLGWSGDLSQWLSFMPSDSGHALVASFHTYNFSGCPQSCWDSTVAPVAASVPVVTGELGENDCAHGYIDGYMSWADTHGVSYLGWAWNTYDCGSFPSLISAYTGTPTAFGVGLQSHLASIAGGPPPLSATSSASTTSGVAPLSVNFTGSASGGTAPYTFAWNFGDGGTSSAQNPSHTFSSAGTFSVTLSVTDAASGHASASPLSISVSALPPLTASSSASTTSGVAPLSVNFTGSASGGTAPYTFAWNFGDGGTSSAQNPSHTFATPGTYSVTLTVTDAAAGHATATPISVVATTQPPCSPVGTPISGDYDADGKADVAFVSSHGTCVLQSNGTSFTPTSWSSTPFYGSRLTLAGDLTGTGKADLVAVNNDTTWVITSTGTTFGAPAEWASQPFYGSIGTYLVDVNGDGKADLVAVNRDSVWVMLSTGTGFAAPTQWSSAAFYGNVATLMGDLTGNGKADLIALNNSSTWVMTSTGSGFGAPTLWSGSPFYGNKTTIVADFNGDGKADLIAVNSSSIWIMTSTGSGFSSPTLGSSSPFYGSVATLSGDVNGDKKADLIAVNPNSVWVETSAGTGYSAPQQWW